MNKNPKDVARLTGILYLLVIICAGFSQGYVRGTIFHPDDARATTDSLMATEGLYRFGLVTDLLAFILDAVISCLLYQLLKPAGKTLAMVSSAFRLLAHPAIASFNLLNHYMALEVIGGQYVAAFSSEQQEALVMFFMNAHNYGYLLAGAFFGVHCLLLGVQLYRSDLFPTVLGLLMLGASAGYLIETFGNFLVPGHEVLLANIVGISAALGEVTLTFYLLIRGTRTDRKIN